MRRASGQGLAYLAVIPVVLIAAVLAYWDWSRPALEANLAGPTTIAKD